VAYNTQDSEKVPHAPWCHPAEHHAHRRPPRNTIDVPWRTAAAQPTSHSTSQMILPLKGKYAGRSLAHRYRSGRQPESAISLCALTYSCCPPCNDALFGCRSNRTPADEPTHIISVTAGNRRTQTLDSQRTARLVWEARERASGGAYTHVIDVGSELAVALLARDLVGGLVLEPMPEPSDRASADAPRFNFGDPPHVRDGGVGRLPRRQ
jgi:hypothetical protein